MGDTENIKLTQCEVCVAAVAKYTCPKCEVRTCSLACVARHKKELSCDGMRNKITYKAVSQMTNLDLLSDYRLLEDISRSVASCRNDTLNRFRTFVRLPTPLYRLQSAAKRREINLKFLPENFSRHTENTSYLDWETQIIHWRVKWIFPQAENFSSVTEKMFEGTTLGMQLDEYLDPECVDKSLRTTLKWYQTAGILGVLLLLKAENVRKSASRFYDLDPTLSLRDNLRAKTLVEYPVIYVILKDHKDNYEIVESDDEEDIPMRQTKNCNQAYNSASSSASQSLSLLSTLSDDSDSDHGSGTKRPKLNGLQIPFYEQLANK